MAPLITENIEQIIAACKRHKVKYLYLFGSAARGSDFKQESDIDFLYHFNKEEIAFPDYADNFFDFLFELEDMLHRKIDLVPEEKIRNPYFLKQVNAEKVKIYGN